MIEVEFRDSLRVHRGRLVADGGFEVHAATYLKEGRIILEKALLLNPKELRRIFLHELFHFAWWRLGNPKRHLWEGLLIGELDRGARGELGWSAESRKNQLAGSDRVRRSRAWREYCCESFCDSGASVFAGAEHDEYTLAATFRRRRKQVLGDIIRDEEELVAIVNPKDRWSGFVWPPGCDGMFPGPYGQCTVA